MNSATTGWNLNMYLVNKIINQLEINYKFTIEDDTM